MADDINLDRLLPQIRALAKAQGMKSAQIADFNRLYQLYNELDDDETLGSADRNSPLREEQAGRPGITPFVADYLQQQTAAQEKYQQNRRYYLLLKSFYNAFVLPLEEDIAIVQASRVLDITSR